jgi:hypothetical protein
MDSIMKPILDTQNLCILIATPSSVLKDQINVLVIGPSTIDERNTLINHAGKWLQSHGLNPCADMTVYMTDPDFAKPPLANQIAGMPGEKAFYMLGGLDHPSFCSQPCRGGGHPNRLGRCPPLGIYR